MPLNSANRTVFDHTTYRDFLNYGVINALAIDAARLVTYASTAQLALCGFTIDEVIGQKLSAIYEVESTDINALLAEKQQVTNLEAMVKTKTGPQKHVLINSKSYTDENGLVNTYLFSRDISAYKKNERLLSYLNKAAEELALARNTHTALKKISNLIVPTFANWFTIDILNDNKLDLLILAHEDPAAIKWAHEFRKNNPPDLNDESSTAKVIKTGQPSLVPVVTHEMVAASIKDPEKLETINKIGIQSIITVAIQSQRTIKGVITFISTIPGKHYDEVDLRFAQNFANHISLALDNARLNEAAEAEIERRRQIESELNITQSQLRSALSSGLVGTWILDPDKNMMYPDESLSKMLDMPYNKQGYDPRTIWAMIHPDDREKARMNRDTSLSTGQIYENEYRIIVNNTVKWFFARGRTEINAGNRMLYSGVTVDITERKKAEAALKQSEDQFKLIAESIPLKIFVTDENGLINYYNPQWEEYTGYPIDEIKKQTLVPFIHPDDLAGNLEQWNAAVKTRDSFQYQHRFKNKEGEYRWHLTRALSLRDEKGDIVKWIGAVTEIHDQIIKEQRKDEFISIASHELRTPLTTVKAFFQLAKRGLNPDDKAFGFIDKAGKQLERLERLIADLLDVSKINAGKMVYNMDAFNFDEALTEAAESVQHTTEDRQIIIEKGTDIIYTGDKLRIEQVITNFLTNAVKYSPGTDKVYLRSEVQGDNIIVSVQDLGIGIAPENLADLFERFYRVDNTSMRFQGLGLGLFIASEIIKRHNGSFWIESEQGKGSTFFFLLPISGKQEFIDLDTDGQTFYKGNFIDIRYNPEMHWLDVDWQGYQNFDSVKKGCLIMLDLLIKNKCTKVLNDNTHVLGNWSEAVDWGAQEWFPAMQRAGLLHFAWVYSPSTFSRISAKKSLDIVMGKITAQFFMDTTEAAEWLKSK